MLRHGVIAESITNFIFKCKTFILCVVNYCTAFNLFQSALNVNCFSFLFLILLFWCCAVFSILTSVLLTEAFVQQLHFIGLPDVGLGDPNRQGYMGMKEKEIPYC